MRVEGHPPAHCDGMSVGWRVTVRATDVSAAPSGRCTGWRAVKTCARVADRARPGPRPARTLARRGAAQTAGDTAHSQGAGRCGPQQAAAAVLGHCRGADRRRGPGVRRGQAAAGLLRAAGRARLEALEAVVEHARERGLLVIADGKRGRYRGQRRRLRAGAVRRHADAVRGGGLERNGDGQPADGPRRGRAICGGRARAPGPGCWCWCATSNPGAADVEDLAACRGRQPCGNAWPRRGRSSAGQESARPGLSDVGAVMGATAPDHLTRARELMPHATCCCRAWARREVAWRISPPHSRRAGRRARHGFAQHRGRLSGERRGPAHAASAEAERLRERPGR